MHNDYEKVSDFEVYEGETTFPPPIRHEVKGGMHITPEVATRKDGMFIMIDWPNGLPRHDTDHTVRFPHGLMRFGETAHECAKRLAQNQLGMHVEAVQVADLDSYMDDDGHWHFEPLIIADVSGTPMLHESAGQTIEVRSADELSEKAV